MYNALDIITIGESLIEFSSDKPLAFADVFTKYYGGDALSVAISALRGGARVGYITKVKNDGFGEYLLDCWQSEGIDAGKVKFSEFQNGICFTGRKNDCSEMQFYRKKTAASTLNVSDIDFNYIKSAKIIFATGFIQSLSLGCREVIKEVFKFAHQNGIAVAYYPNFAHSGLLVDEAYELFVEVSQYVDIAFVNTKNNLIFDTESPDLLITKLSDMQIENSLIIKEGEEIWAIDRTEVSSVKVPEFEPVDFTGYSTNVIGAYLSSKLRGESRLDALKYSNISGMMGASKFGSIKSIPHKKDILEVLKRYYG